MKSLSATIIVMLLGIATLESVSIYGIYNRQPNKVNTQEYKHKVSYQIQIVGEDTLAIWDNNRLVGKIGLTDDSEIGELIDKDNQ